MRKASTTNYLILTMAIIIHAWLCYAPSYQRGYPQMNPYMEYLAPFSSILVVFLAAPLNSHLSRAGIRTRRIGFAIVYSIGLGGALQFRIMGHAIPNHGPYLFDTLIIAAIAVIPTVVVLRLVERLVDNHLVHRKIDYPPNSTST